MVTFSAIDSMQADNPMFLFKLVFVKYDASDEGNPAAERKLSKSCIVNRKTI